MPPMEPCLPHLIPTGTCTLEQHGVSGSLLEASTYSLLQQQTAQYNLEPDIAIDIHPSPQADGTQGSIHSTKYMSATCHPSLSQCLPLTAGLLKISVLMILLP